MEMLAVQPLSAFVSNHWSTTKKRKTTRNRRTWPISGELLQTGIAPDTSSKKLNTGTKTKPKLLLYKGRGPSPHHNAGKRRRREGEGPAGPDLERTVEREGEVG
jgi:hypothetical protein